MCWICVAAGLIAGAPIPSGEKLVIFSVSLSYLSFQGLSHIRFFSAYTPLLHVTYQ